SDPGDLPIKNVNACAESDDKGHELGTPAIVSTDTIENKSLPFVKCSPLWKNIESMEIYKTQKPHFSPLVNCKEVSREGLAIGMLVNFFNLVQNTSKLKFSSDIAVIERSLESLAEFESYGFNVEKIRASLTQLLSKKQRAEELEKELEDIQSVICNNSLDVGKLDEEIIELYEKFKEIERKLGEAKFEKEMREKEILALQSKRGVVRETFQSLQTEFESIVGSLSLCGK
ncbi:hypothetical protein A2U01_0036910, partial [Trifolium medium]|nr:hypothetical protein [Trifolium medium]